MLDQNTDRMWYVIGAVIVGAALIFLMNGTMPDLFASVGKTFEDKVEDVKGIVSEIEVDTPGEDVPDVEEPPTLTDGIAPPTKSGPVYYENNTLTEYLAAVAKKTPNMTMFTTEGYSYWSHAKFKDTFTSDDYTLTSLYDVNWLRAVVDPNADPDRAGQLMATGGDSIVMMIVYTSEDLAQQTVDTWTKNKQDGEAVGTVKITAATELHVTGGPYYVATLQIVAE